MDAWGNPLNFGWMRVAAPAECKPDQVLWPVFIWSRGPDARNDFAAGDDLSRAFTFSRLRSRPTSYAEWLRDTAHHRTPAPD